MDQGGRKEEHEAMMNRKMEEMKKKNAELLRRHQLAEADKRLAEEQGRSVTIRSQQTYSPMKGEILRAAEEERERQKTKQQNNNSSNRPDSKKLEKPRGENSTVKNDVPPPDPSCSFLADRHREGSFADANKGKEFSRRHPRNFGGKDFRDVPKKIHDEKEKLINQPQVRLADSTVYTTGKERRELAEWRKEREVIDRERLERQKSKEGTWKREWDRDKDSGLSYCNQPNEPRSLGSRQPVPLVSRPVGRIGSGRFFLGHHKLSGLHKSFGRKDDRLKVSAKGRPYQRYRNEREDSKTENPYEFAETKPNKMYFSSVQSEPKFTPDTVGGRQLRMVCEKNDSLVIEVKNEPLDSTKSPNAKSVTFVEPNLTGSGDHNNRRNRKYFREVPNFRSCGGGNHNSLDSLTDSSRTFYKRPKNNSVQKYARDSSQPYYSVSNLDKNVPKHELITSETNTKISQKDDEVEQDEARPSIENNSPQALLESSEVKGERLVGSGRIGVRSAARKRNNKRNRGKQSIQKNSPAKYRNGEGAVRVEGAECEKVVTSKKGKEKDKESNSEDQSTKIVQVSASKNQGETSGVSERISERKNCKAEKNSVNSPVHVEVPFVNSDHLDSSFDLDQDPPDGDQLDDEEWEDIDEEVCIDLIDREEEQYEDGVLDMSDENFDKFIRESAIPSRNHVDWAAEMERIEHRSADDQLSVVETGKREDQ